MENSSWKTLHNGRFVWRVLIRDQERSRTLRNLQFLIKGKRVWEHRASVFKAEQLHDPQRKAEGGVGVSTPLPQLQLLQPRLGEI